MKKPLNTKLLEPYNKMTAAELERDTSKFDAEFVAKTSRPLTAAERKRHTKAKRRGRPRIGLGAMKIRISIETSLLHKADALAAKRKVSRSQLIAEAVTGLFAS